MAFAFLPCTSLWIQHPRSRSSFADTNGLLQAHVAGDQACGHGGVCRRDIADHPRYRQTLSEQRNLERTPGDVRARVKLRVAADFERVASVVSAAGRGRAEDDCGECDDRDRRRRVPEEKARACVVDREAYATGSLKPDTY